MFGQENLWHMIRNIEKIYFVKLALTSIFLGNKIVFMATLLVNKKVNFEYEILDTFEAGMVLSGKMVKLMRSKKIQVIGKYIISQQNQLQIISLGNESLTQNIPLLLSKKEKQKILAAITQKGITCILVSIYTQKRWLKAQVALVKGKKLYDKREALKKRDLERDARVESTN